MSDLISRDAVAKAVATLSQEFLDGGSPTAVKVLNLAMDRIRAIPVAATRAEALKEAAKRVSELMLPASTQRQSAKDYNTGLSVAYDAILALILETKP